MCLSQFDNNLDACRALYRDRLRGGLYVAPFSLFCTLHFAYMRLGYMFFMIYGPFWVVPNRLLRNKIGQIYGFPSFFRLYGLFWKKPY